MRRVVDVVQVVFWASVPLFGAYLAVTPRDGRLGWPGEVLWWVVVVSAAYLTVRLNPLAPREDGDGPIEARRRRLETGVYPVVLFVAAFLFAYQVGDTIY